MLRDLLGRIYESVMTPDEIIPVNWERLGKADDPLITAALAWLKTQV